MSNRGRMPVGELRRPHRTGNANRIIQNALLQDCYNHGSKVLVLDKGPDQIGIKISFNGSSQNLFQLRGCLKSLTQGRSGLA